MTLRVVPLGSGSGGNATLVELGGTRLLVDAGLAARTLARRLAAIGVEPRTLAGILVSHEHGDHASGVERFSTRFGVPVHAAYETLAALDLSYVHVCGFTPFLPGQPFEVGDVVVDPFPVPHDAALPVGFVLTRDGMRVGVATDLGHATTLVVERLRGCDVLVIESNYDPDMLRDGPYPWALKQRVAGRTGHLSNAAAADLIADVVDERLKAIVLAHLSEHNNTPELARRTAAAALARTPGCRAAMRVATRRGATPAIVIGPGGR
jgi:phosphoribosyl 1,2-cyclic phosphodiesterase